MRKVTKLLHDFGSKERVKVTALHKKVINTL